MSGCISFTVFNRASSHFSQKFHPVRHCMQTTLEKMMAFTHFFPVSNSCFLHTGHALVNAHKSKCRVLRNHRFTFMKIQAEDEPEPEAKTTRLFSNVKLNERGELKRQKTSEWSCAALIAVRH